MRVIFTKYLSTTTTQPQRVKAYDSDGNSYIMGGLSCLKMPDDVSVHALAVRKFCQKMGWLKHPIRFQPGCIKGGEYAFVEVKEDKIIEIGD